MVGTKLGNSHEIVTQMLLGYIERQLRGGNITKTAEGIGQYLTGMKTSRRYRPDLSEPERLLVSREFLRGVLTDYSHV